MTYRYDFGRAELVPMQSATGSGDVIACTHSRYQALSARLAERRPQLLSLTGQPADLRAFLAALRDHAG